ncbi:hypothetical protein M514_05076 [Trichuris suis]|uniref:Uncharacterized protein n=1 Tax=Trichuris suis TaxID=68888 RepID=A0A085NCR8_9BILA|nr:hypothetical protein M513_05076 [Trichuris suis]KFD67264.1 hypothetical protein M514_05076 [Trichuris suis]
MPSERYQEYTRNCQCTEYLIITKRLALNHPNNVKFKLPMAKLTNLSCPCCFAQLSGRGWNRQIVLTLRGVGFHWTVAGDG